MVMNGTDMGLPAKYNVPVPRYTSYPTVPVWREGMTGGEWEDVFRKDFEVHNGQQGIALAECALPSLGKQHIARVLFDQL